jgi:hypothetical protein
VPESDLVIGRAESADVSRVAVLAGTRMRLRTGSFSHQHSCHVSQAPLLVEAGHVERIRATQVEAGYPTGVDHGKQRALP